MGVQGQQGEDSRWRRVPAGERGQALVAQPGPGSLMHTWRNLVVSHWEV